MAGKPTLLVIAHEPHLVCQGCQSLLVTCGVHLRTASTSADALHPAADCDLLGMLLRISGSDEDRATALKVLAQKQPETPAVLLMDSSGLGTAHSIASPGVTDCLIEPISPEDLTQAVWRLLRKGDAFSTEIAPLVAGRDDPGVGSNRYSFWNESWFRLNENGLAAVGVTPALPRRGDFKSVSLPQVGDVVYQGLPLAFMHAEGMPPCMLPSPLSGVVVAINEELENGADPVLADPCGRGWVAVICPTRLEAESSLSRTRGIVLVNGDADAAVLQSRHLSALGCQAKTVSGWPEAVQMLWDRSNTVVVLDAASLGDQGLEIASRIRSMAPEMKLVVVAPAGACVEFGYRQLGVFYYAIEPFADGEIADILDAAFRPAAAGAETRDPAPEPFRGIRITNRDGEKVRLLTVGGPLQQGDTLGAWIRRKLQDRLIPYETIGVEGSSTPAFIRAEAAKCQRLVVLATRDVGRLPGSLVRDGRGELVPMPSDAAGRMVGMIIQPDVRAGHAGRSETGTIAFLAEHIVNEMTLSWRVPGSRPLAGSPRSTKHKTPV
jgi:glycine cleavage system H lipoate-binding protein/CheY-like chemotaxis protein